MNKLLGVFLILALGVMAFLAVQMQMAELRGDSLESTIAQLKMDMETKLKGMSTTIDGVTARLTSLEQGHGAAPSPVVTPPVVASPPISAPAPQSAAPESVPTPTPSASPAPVAPATAKP